MPTLQVKTVAAQQVWASPDGQRTIHELALEHNGAQFKAKTYSGAIAKVGWSGEVESYEKAGKAGPETFVKQPAKENGFGGSTVGWSGGGSSGSSSGSSSGGGKSFTQDSFAMYMSYAKDLAVVMVETGGYDAAQFKKLLKAVAEGGHALYEARPGAEPKSPESAAQKIFGDDVVVEDISHELLSLEDLPDL